MTGEGQISLLQANMGGREESLLSQLSPSFARHETFHPRFAWLKKGYDAIQGAPFAFSQDDIAVRIGVGKNMARAIRYWCMAFKVIEERYDPVQKRRGLYPTEFGDKLLKEDGWDPYLEDEASLWLLHWNLLRAPNMATTWFFTFYCFPQISFHIDQLLESLVDFREKFLPEAKAVRTSLQKDLNCLMRMYVDHLRKSGPLEDSIDCPFTKLNLIQSGIDSKRYSFVVGKKTTLPLEVIVATALQYAAQEVSGAQSIGLNRVLYDIGSPGMAFKLTETCLTQAFDQVAMRNSSLKLEPAGGSLQLMFKEEPEQLANKLLDNWFFGA